MTTTHRLLLSLLPLALLCGCPSPTEPNPGPQTLPDPVVDQLDPIGQGDLVPDPPGPDEGIRNRRRMDLDQLQSAIESVTGGIFWGATTGDRKFDDLAQTLGKPDYLDITTEDLSPSMLFQKFLGDAARDVCEQLVDREVSSNPEDRVLIVEVALDDTVETNPSGVEANLIYLLTRFHSTQLESGSPELNPWSWLFESSVQVTDDPVAAWRTVCVGLIIHPNFYSY